MKSIFKFSFLLIFCTGLHAQHVDLDRDGFTYRYTRLPDLIIDSTLTTYSINVHKTVALEYYSNESVFGMINIQGMKKVGSSGHILVNINMEDLIIESSDVKERVEIKKDKEGKETGRYYYYKVDVVYSFQAGATIYDHTGKQLTGYNLASYRDKKTYSTSEYSKSSEAINFYNNNKLEIKTQLVSGEIKNAISSLNSSLNYAFGYMAITSNEILWLLGSKKHEEFTPYVEACNLTKSVLEGITCSEIPANTMSQLQPAIDYFVKLTEKYTDAEDKGQKKLRYGAFYNLATIYSLTEQFDKATEYANKLIANDYDSKDGERIIKENTGIQESLSKHNMNTRHFIRDVSDAQPPQ
jgi:hypothetical protein